MDLSRNLMLGDWVYLSEKTEYPMRVTEIDQYNCSLDFEGNEADPFDGIYGENGIAPIELTADILLLNDWCYNHLDGYWGNVHTDKIVLEATNVNGEPVLCVFDGEITLTYVHELQHIMRLYGLNDMADNFKIKKEEQL